MLIFPQGFQIMGSILERTSSRKNPSESWECPHDPFFRSPRSISKSSSCVRFNREVGKNMSHPSPQSYAVWGRWRRRRSGNIFKAPSDKSHINPKVVKRIEGSWVARVLKLPNTCKNLKPPFLQALRNCLQTDCGLRNVVGVGDLPLQFFKQLNYSDPVSQHRISLNPGDFVRLGGEDGEIVRYDLAFVHEMWKGERRILAIVTETQASQEKDRITGLDVLQLKKSQRIVGLSVFSPKPLYVVALAPELRASPLSFEKFVGFSSGEIVKGGDLLFVNWDISFL